MNGKCVRCHDDIVIPAFNLRSLQELLLTEAIGPLCPDCCSAFTVWLEAPSALDRCAMISLDKLGE